MNFEEELEKAAAEMEREKRGKWRKDPRWLNIKGVTKEDLINGSAYIEKLPYPPWDSRNNKGAQQVNQTNLVGFGKYSSKEVSWVRDNDSNYFNWMLENVPKFAAKVKQLGL